ncbi:signal peptide peptidase SppA, 36K type [Desulfurobacterium thermolithotrophum DSM 11699]|uniref:Signal peptide peptidase SppA, 36K type n=1 Tax=Desulfurobacterium thermolithotrophum (strain DSM 11699 / BSA) TaxID=868864 RepID=F0S2K8_DESTD|nr:signal peptide peptidase SppA [Desulfurobacterium thermolithotrophum]ADY73080.1 signal peptide peptidase SppA, 36K type [Desulfurobacterium thermolithotrophum DSM 11699]
MRRLKKFFTFLGIVFFILILFSIFKGFFSSKVAVPGEKIGVVKVEGVIKRSDTYVKLLDKLERNKEIKAIVLRVDSPGGVVGACQEIYDKVKEITKKKPIVVSMGSIAASGGLYISVPATKIVANPGTITGSIGVILQAYNVKELADKVGIKVITVKSGKFKDLLNPFREPDKGSLQILQALINDSYEQFVEAVAKGRKLPIEKVKKFADGRVFTGRQAKKLGLVDELGGFEKAVEIARKLSKSPSAKVFEAKPERTFLQKLLGEKTEGMLNNLSRVLNGEIKDFYLMYLLD